MAVTQDGILDTVRTAVAEAMFVDKDEVQPDTKLFVDLGAESIDLLDILFRVERQTGIKVEVDERAPPDSRVVATQVNGEPLDPGRRYRVATNNFMLAGGDGYAALGRGRILIGATDGKLLANEVMVYIRRLGVVEAHTEGRIVIR